MQARTLFTLLAATSGAVSADFVVDYYSSYDSCDADDDPGKSSTFTENCFQVNGNYEALKLSSSNDNVLEQCGPFFEDSECTREMQGAEPWTCSSCIGYVSGYVYVA